MREINKYLKKHRKQKKKIPTQTTSARVLIRTTESLARVQRDRVGARIRIWKIKRVCCNAGKNAGLKI